MSVERVFKVKSPVLFDKVIGSIQDGLAVSFPWLDHLFGRVERLTKPVQGARVMTPNVYVGGNEYMQILPDQGLGNFCFFLLDDPFAVEWSVGDTSRLEAAFSLVVWVDMRTIEDDDERNTERVKADILRALNGGIWIRTGSIIVESVYSQAERVFAGFTLDEVDNQFLMSPFAGFRFEGKMKVKDECY